MRDTPPGDVPLAKRTRVRPTGPVDTTPPRIISVAPDPARWIVDNVGVPEVQIGFDEAVTIPPEATTVWTVGGGAITDFATAYDGGTDTLTITFDSPVRDDRLTVVVDYTVTDLAGNELDGEILSPSNPALPSGDGRRGGQAVFRINILQGDANRDGTVDATDGTIVQASLGQCTGDAGFDADADLNGDGCVNVLDVGTFTLAEGLSLPTTDGIAPHVAGRTPGANDMFPTSGLTSAVVVFSEPVNPASITPSSLFVVKPNGSLQLAMSVELGNGNTVATYGFVPALDTEQAYEFNLSNAIADPGGLFLSPTPSRVWSASLVALPPVQQTDTAIILGQVFHAETGEPIEGAEITTRLFPAAEGAPNLPPVAVTDATGHFEYTTIPITGVQAFLLQIRKDGFAENLRQIAIMAGRCWRADDATLNPTTPPVPVTVIDGDMLTDQTGEVTLEIPPGALQQDSNIGITTLASHEAIRDDLPQLVATAGTFIDISGVFGDETNLPVTLNLPNQYNLPLGTELRFGKIDHNTLEWMDLETAPGIGVGIVKSDGKDGSLIEVKFDHFCTVCTGYCLPFSPPDITDGSRSGGGEGGGCGEPGNIPGNSVINQREGYLWETFSPPSFREIGQPWGLSFAYFSAAANPSASLSATIDFDSTRPVEKTIFEFDIEGLTVEAAYGFSENNQKHHGTFIWNGRNGLGDLMPTGSYLYRIMATSLNADAPVALTNVFGGTPTQILGGVTYPGLTPLSSDPIENRVVLVNLTDSPYGAGWSLVNEHRLHFDPDGCIVVLSDNADWRLFVPVDPETDPDNFISPAGDFSTLERKPDGTYVRNFNDGTAHFFTPTGRIDRIVDRYGYTTLYTYQGDLLTRVTSPTGYFYELVYAGGRLSQIVDSTGRVTNVIIDANGDLVSATLPDGAARTFEYDTEHLLVAQNGARGERSEYDYQTGRIVEARAFDIDGITLLRRRQFSPSVLNGEISEALQSGLGSLINPIPLVADRVDVYVDGRGQTWLNETDDRGNTIRDEDPLGRATTMAYDANNLLTSRTRPNGSITEFEYDAFGNRTVQRELFNGAITRFEYLGPFQRVSKVTDPRGNETNFAHLPNGSLSQIADALVNTTSLLYEDPRFPNSVTTIRDALNNNTALTYDARGNAVTLTNPLDRTTSFEYDERGNLSAVVDGRGERTEMSYDSQNRLTEIRDALLQVTELQYDEAACGCRTDNITRVLFPNLTEMQFQYDGLGRQIGETDQLGKQKSFTYDAEGRPTVLVNRNGERIDFTYDAVGQLIRKELPGNELTPYEYDILGNLSFAENMSARLTFEYDGLGRLSGTTQTITVAQGFVPADREETLAYQYDLAGNRTGMTTSFGDVVYAYDDLNRLTTLTNPFLETWTFLYNSLGALTESRLPNTVVSRSTYNQGLELSEISHETATGTQLVGLSYIQYDGSGNSTHQIVNNSNGPTEFTYAYDGLSRLVSTVTDPSPTADTVSVTSPFDFANRIETDGRFIYSHDTEGRLVSKLDTDQALSHSYRYNAQGQLLEYSEITDQDPPVSVLKVQYSYDPLGRRVSKNVEGAASSFFYDGINRLSDVENGSGVTTFYTNGLGIDEPLSRTNTGTSETFYYHQDRLGSVVALTDALGNVVQEYEYDAFGSIVAQVGFLANPFAYTGRELDSESGLYYYRARYYDSTAGRFLSEDPLGINGGSNLYAYVENNPISFTDPTGKILQAIPVFCALNTGLCYAIAGYIVLKAAELYEGKALPGMPFTEIYSFYAYGLDKLQSYVQSHVQSYWESLPPHVPLRPCDLDIGIVQICPEDIQPPHEQMCRPR